MTQNTLVNTLFLKPGLMEISQKNTARESLKKDDTFKNILDERIHAAGNSRKAPSQPLKKVNEVPASSVDKTESGNEPIKLQANTADITGEAGIAKSNTVSKAETEIVVQAEDTVEPSDSGQDQETLDTLESMLAVLEELLARLDVKTVYAEPDKSSETEVPVQKPAEGVSIMDLLKALVEGNRDKLEALIEKVDESQIAPEFKSIVENIRKLLNDVTEACGNELTLETEKLEISKEDVLNQLKAQCGEIIEKLKEKISEVKNNVQPPEIKADGTLKPAPETPPAAQTGEQSKEENLKEEPGDITRKPDERPQHLPNQAKEHVSDKVMPENRDTSPGVIVPDEKNTQQITAEKTEKPFPLSEKPLAQTVTNQVMMKVKLMAGEHKQEMEMHLKPENLGKLSLKIIHERGEILAKITAENEQVKGIIESNMQLLKDSLEKSGLSVQSLSVSVGNGNEKNEPKQDSEKGNMSGMRNVTGTGRNQPQPGIIYEHVTGVRGYYEPESQINLTA